MEHNAYILDSSVWIALFYKNDTLHLDAVGFFELIDTTRQIIVPQCVIFEVCNVLSYRHSPEKAGDFLDFIENNNGIVIVPDHLSVSLRVFRSLKVKISLTDIHLIQTAKNHGYDLVTFDHQMKKLYEKIT